jgi:hypothetical protein
MRMSLFHDIRTRPSELQKAARLIRIQIEAGCNIRKPPDFKSALPIEPCCTCRTHLQLGCRVRIPKPALGCDSDASVRIARSVRWFRVMHRVGAEKGPCPALTKVERYAERECEINQTEHQTSNKTGEYPEPYGSVVVKMREMQDQPRKKVPVSHTCIVYRSKKSSKPSCTGSVTTLCEPDDRRLAGCSPEGQSSGCVTRRTSTRRSSAVLSARTPTTLHWSPS